MTYEWYVALGVLGLLMLAGGLLASWRAKRKAKLIRVTLFGAPVQSKYGKPGPGHTPEQWRAAAERSLARSRERRERR